MQNRTEQNRQVFNQYYNRRDLIYRHLRFLIHSIYPFIHPSIHPSVQLPKAVNDAKITTQHSHANNNMYCIKLVLSRHSLTITPTEQNSAEQANHTLYLFVCLSITSRIKNIYVNDLLYIQETRNKKQDPSSFIISPHQSHIQEDTPNINMIGYDRI